MAALFCSVLISLQVNDTPYLPFLADSFVYSSRHTPYAVTLLLWGIYQKPSIVGWVERVKATRYQRQ